MGSGPIAATAITALVPAPEGFRAGRDFAAWLGLTPKRHQSGEVDRSGHISKTGDAQVRTALFEAAHVMLLRVQRFSALKAWALRVARARGLKRAKVALARKLAVVLHRLWVDGTEFRWGREAEAAV